MAGSSRWAWIKAVLFAGAMAAGSMGAPQAGWELKPSAEPGFNTPATYANSRTIDFSTVTMAVENTAGRLTTSQSLGGGSLALNDVLSLVGMGGSHLKLTSPSNTNRATYTINFGNGGTSYVYFLWNLGLIDQDGTSVTYTFSDGTTQTLYSCKDSANPSCLGAYASSNFLTDLFNFATLCLFGCNRSDTVSLTYIPSTGVKITSVSFSVGRCDSCGFLGSATAQSMYIDNLIYVDPLVGPHHMEVTAPSATAAAGGNITFTVKACANAACSSLYTTGMTGTLTVTGAGMVAAHPAGQLYTIGARSATTTVTESISPSGTATVTLTAPSIAPSGSPSVYCGLGVAAAAGNPCTLSISQTLHHLEVTTSAVSGSPGNALTYAITACADALCTAKYNGGVSGTLTVSGVTVSGSAGQAFNIASGATSTTVNVTPTQEGTMTVALTSPTPVPTSTPQVYCGIGVPATVLGTCGFTSVYTLHHMELTTDNATNVSCAPTTYRVKACANASCSVLYTKGVSGSLAVTGPGLTISYPAGATFNTGATGLVDVQSWNKLSVSSLPTATAAATATLVWATPVATNPVSLFCGMGTAAVSGGSCTSTVANSMLTLSVPNHAAETPQSLTISAVKSNADSSACTSLVSVPTLIPLTLACTYTEPSSGSKALTVAGVSLGCGTPSSPGLGKLINVSFQPSGLGTVSLSYPDVGRIDLSALLSGVATLPGLNLIGSGNFVAYPSSFSLVPSASTVTSGQAFSMQVKALTAGSNVAPNFGTLTTPVSDFVRLTWTKTAPAGGQAGSFTGSGLSSGTPLSSGNFQSGAGTVNPNNLQWTEVGTGTLSATMVGGSYLSVPVTTTGSTTLTFKPASLSIDLSQGCSNAFTYSGQPFTAVIKALNGLGNVTQNYDGVLGLSKVLTLSTNAQTVGSLDDTTVPANLFANGVATVNRVFTFAQKLTVPTDVSLSAIDATGVLTSAVGGIKVRSGRLKVSNAFASSIDAPLVIPVQAQYFSASKVWVVNNKDSCTTVPASAIGLTNFVNHKGEPMGTGFINSAGVSGIAISGGTGSFTLTPNPAAQGLSGFKAGSVDFSINLGAGADQSCLGNRPSTTGAARSWPRAQNGTAGACAGSLTFDKDPSARATFGIFQPESKKAVFTREMY